MQSKLTTEHGNRIHALREQQYYSPAAKDALNQGVSLMMPGPSRCDEVYGCYGNEISWTEVCQIVGGFPATTHANVNMLPFIMGDISSLPKELHQYFPMIEACNVEPEQIGKVCYLTVQESDVLAGGTQRREGLHIEAPPAGNQGPGGMLLYHWGGGTFGGGAEGKDRPRGGIYMASNVANSTAVYDAQVNVEPMHPGPPQGADGRIASWASDCDGFYPAGHIQTVATVGEHGDIEHLRPLLQDTEFHLFPNTIYWMTDRTPHEALPTQAGTHRQYFRLVTSEISVWYRFHSTANPKVALPETVKVIEGSKFMTARDRRALQRDDQRK